MPKKKRSLEDTYDVVLPEIGVMPRGTYIDYTGKETFKPTYTEFEKANIDKAKTEAVHKMLNTKAPLIPDLPSRSYLSRFAGLLGMNDYDRKFVFGKDKNGHTCIYTVTNQYNDSYAIVPGNKTFKNNPEKYGFVSVPMNETQQGDLIQFSYPNGTPYHGTPYHGTMVTGFNRKREPVLTYSNGERTENTLIRDENGNVIRAEPNMKKDRELDWFIEETNGVPSAYRYVGTKEKKRSLRNRYNHLYNK